MTYKAYYDLAPKKPAQQKLAEIIEYYELTTGQPAKAVLLHPDTLAQLEYIPDGMTIHAQRYVPINYFYVAEQFHSEVS